MEVVLGLDMVAWSNSISLYSLSVIVLLHTGQLAWSDEQLLLPMEAFVSVDQLYEMRLEIRKDVRVSMTTLQMYRMDGVPPIMKIV